jgi:hypothetical protein
MFVIHMPRTFKVGDTMDCRINGESQCVTWRDETTLVIEPDDARAILMLATERDLLCFMCGDQSENANDYGMEETPGGFVLSRRAGGR